MKHDQPQSRERCKECGGTREEHDDPSEFVAQPQSQEPVNDFREGALFASEKAGKRILELTKEIAELKSQLEQAKKLHETDREINRSLANHNSKITEQLEQARDLIHGEDGYIASQKYLQEQLEQAKKLQALCEKTMLIMDKRLTQAQAEKIEAAKDAARYADLFYKAQAEANRYKSALERYRDVVAPTYSDKGISTRDSRYVAREALAEKEQPKDE